MYESYFNTVYNGDLGICARDTAIYSVNMTAKNNATVKCCIYAYDVIIEQTYDVYNCGLYDNIDDANKDYVTLNNRFDDINNPCVFLLNDYRVFLKQNSRFIDPPNSYMYDYDSELPGKSPFIDGKPDSNFADIWVHHQTRQFTATSDLTGDGIVDSNDTNEIMNYLGTNETISDI